MKWQSFIGLVCALFFVAAMLSAASPVNAAPTPISGNCVLDSTIGTLEVYYCESDFGVDYIVNSFGFMAIVD